MKNNFLEKLNPDEVALASQQALDVVHFVMLIKNLLNVKELPLQWESDIRGLYRETKQECEHTRKGV